METVHPSSSNRPAQRRTTHLPRVRVEHAHAHASELLHDRHTLAVIGFGAKAALSDDPRCTRVALEPLHSPAPLEVWRTTRTVSCDRTGLVCWASDNDYSFASIELDEAEYGGIAAATREAYRLMLSWCRSSPTPHLLRIWNYIDAINLGNGDDERYRQFCSGRAAGMTPPSDLVYPAATAIGVRNGRRRLQICWLAARGPGSPWENPRQVSAWQYPRQYGPDAPGFARGMRAPVNDGQLYVSGTAAVVGHASHHVGDIRAQVSETLANLDALLGAAGLAAAARYATSSVWRVYVRHTDDAGIVECRVRERLGNDAGVLLINGDICRTELLVEIDGVHGI